MWHSLLQVTQPPPPVECKRIRTLPFSSLTVDGRCSAHLPDGTDFLITSCLPLPTKLDRVCIHLSQWIKVVLRTFCNAWLSSFHLPSLQAVRHRLTGKWWRGQLVYSPFQFSKHFVCILSHVSSSSPMDYILLLLPVMCIALRWQDQDPDSGSLSLVSEPFLNIFQSCGLSDSQGPVQCKEVSQQQDPAILVLLNLLVALKTTSFFRIAIETLL